MTGVTELGYMTLGVSDLDAWKTFAAQVLGLEVVPSQDPDTCHLRMDYWRRRVTLVRHAADDLLITGLRLAGQDEFREMAARLEAAGVPFRIGSQAEAEARFVLEVMMLADPNGHAIELFHGPLVQFDKPFHPGRPMHGRFKTGHGGLGHIMQSQTAGFDETYAFYRLLGMRGGIEYKMAIPGVPEPIPLMFLHCNERQHTLAFSGPGPKRINHVMFEVENMADVGLAHDLVTRSGLPVVIQPGSHANDQMFSFYFKNPSGFMNEIGWGGRPSQAQSEYYEGDSFGHAPTPGSMKGFMVPA
jgi:2,3-dihydroxyethylbenzene 1,2-dioxygenase